MTGVGRGLTGLMAAAAVCAGCRTPRPEAPPEMPSAWTAPADPAAVTAEGSDWWRGLGGSELAVRVEEALRANRDLAVAVARVEAAGAAAGIAGAAARPTLGLDLDALRRQQNFVGLPIPGAEDRVLSTRFNTFGAALNLSWELDLWGRVRAGRRAAEGDLQAAEEDARAARESIAAQTAKAWFATVESSRQLDLARRTAETFSVTEQQVAARYEQGLRDALDLRLARSNVGNARALVAQREQGHREAVRRLEILLGRAPTGRLEAPGDLPPVPSAIPAGLPSGLLDRRPDLRAADRRLSATVARVDEARAALFPRLALTTSGGRSSGELEDLLSAGFNVWSIGANVAQPLLQGGRLRGGIRLAEARAREASAAYGGAVLRALGEVEGALDGEQWLAEREAALGAAARESAAAARLAAERYRAGLEPFVTLLEAQRRALDAESGWLQVRRVRLDNRVDLHLALGGGFVPPTPGGLRPGGESARNE